MKPRAIWACFALAGLASAQQKVGKPTFEVAIIKPSDPNPSNPILVGMAADRAIVRYGNITLRDAIRGAYKVRDFQIVGPDWMSTARFQIEAKLPEGATTDQIPEMFQALLEERFKLTTRPETKETQVYALLVGGDGPKLKPSELKIDDKTPTAMGTDGKPRPLVYFGGSSSSVTVTAPGANVLALVGVVSRFTARPVVDLTGIDGQYDFSLTFAPEVSTGFPGAPGDAPGAAEPAPVLADAVKKYGLRIETRKMPVEMLVITHIERTPTDN